jgi:hypothetical protein
VPKANTGMVIAALVGLVGTIFTALVGYKIHSDDQSKVRDLQQQVQTMRGIYEWQWAGDRWLGRITISSDQTGQLRAMVSAKQHCQDKWVDFMEGQGPAFQQNGDLRVEISAHTKMHDYNCQITHEGSTTITGDLQPVVAFAGTVIWRENGQESPGDMVLVKYTSSLLRSFQ